MIITDKIKPLFRDVIQLYRCSTCQKITSLNSDALSKHAGHFIKQPVNLSFFEFIYLKIVGVK